MSSSDFPSSKANLVIVGNGMVGHHCVEQLVGKGAVSEGTRRNVISRVMTWLGLM